jgi:hypothetical protein
METWEWGPDMSEKRVPSIVLTARKHGKKRLKVELFPASLWGKFDVKRYRVRVNGRWEGGSGVAKRFFSLSHIVADLRKYLAGG